MPHLLFHTSRAYHLHYTTILCFVHIISSFQRLPETHPCPPSSIFLFTDPKFENHHQPSSLLCHNLHSWSNSSCSPQPAAVPPLDISSASLISSFHHPFKAFVCTPSKPAPPHCPCLLHHLLHTFISAPHPSTHPSPWPPISLSSSNSFHGFLFHHCFGPHHTISPICTSHAHYCNGEPRYVIGRTMFETDLLTPEHVRRCNRMDSVWVPTDFHVSMFVQSGVGPAKVVKVVQPVDVDFFDPVKQQALVLPDRAPVLGSRTKTKEFVFLSVFKWEHRKGWDVLLKSFLEEFSGSDGVTLYLLVSAYHSDEEFGRKIVDFVERCGMKEPAHGWAPIYVVDRHVPQTELPGMYKATNAFVLPSRGEGWGRPIVEAMAMGLPVIATNWSGLTEYLTEENGYPLPVDRMSEVLEGPFKGHLWAEPSGAQLGALMRRVASNPEEGKGRGRRAREDMIRRFAPQVVARILVDQILKISKN